MLCAACTPAPAPATDTSAAPLAVAPLSPLDAAIDRAFADAKITPAAAIDDATFLRRASLDLLGRIPREAEILAFERLPATGRRAALVDALLDSDEHAAFFARTWTRRLFGPEAQNRVADRGAFERWLRERVKADAPWSSIVAEIIAGEGKSSRGEKRADARDEIAPDDAAMGGPSHEVAGAANLAVRYARAPEDLAGTTARAFLGVEIQCAQCHDHKTEAWKQADFAGLASAFMRTRVESIEREKGKLPIFDVEDTNRVLPRYLKDEERARMARTPPRALDGTALEGKDGPRRALATWMTRPENPYFARAFVNRVFADTVGAGFVEPVTDMRPSNPPAWPEVLEMLAARFTDSGFTIDDLYRDVMLSRAYDRALGGSAPAGGRVLGVAALRPLSADQLVGSIFAATDVDRALPEGERGARARAALRRDITFVFEDDGESNSDSFDGTLTQALSLMNGPIASGATNLVKGGALESVLRTHTTTADRVTSLYLRTLGRPPSEEELRDASALIEEARGEPQETERARKNVEAGERARAGKEERKQASRRAAIQKQLTSRAETPEERAYEDLFWALINASEFYFRR